MPRRGPLRAPDGGVAASLCCCCCRCSCWWYCCLGGDSCSTLSACCLPGRLPATWLCTANSGARAAPFGCASRGAAAVASVKAAAVAAAEVAPARRCCSRAVRLASGGRSLSLSLSPLQRSTISDAGIATDSCGAMGSYHFKAKRRGAPWSTLYCRKKAMRPHSSVTIARPSLSAFRSHQMLALVGSRALSPLGAGPARPLLSWSLSRFLGSIPEVPGTSSSGAQAPTSQQQQQQHPPPPPVPPPGAGPGSLSSSTDSSKHWLDRHLPGLRLWLEDKNRYWWIKGVVVRCR